jgi:MFS family permease
MILTAAPKDTRRNLPRVTAGEGLRHDPAFRRYWSANAISTAGSSISLVVFPLLMFQRSGSPLLTSLLETAYIGPYVLLGLVAGAIADRLDRRRLMIGSQLGSAVAIGSIPVAAGLGILTTEQIFVVTAASGTLFVFFDAAQFGALPTLFGRSRLIGAMAAMASVNSALYSVGNAVGGVLANSIGAASALGTDAASFVMSAVLLFGIGASFGTASTEDGPGRGRRLRRDVAEGVHYLWGHRVIRALTLAGTAAALTGGAVMGLLVILAVRQLGLSDKSLTRRFDIPLLNLVSRTMSLVLVVALAILRVFVVALVVYVAFAIAETLAIRSAITYRQLNTLDHLQGRVNVVGRMTALVGQPLGAALGGLVADVANVRTALLVMSLGLAASTVGGWLGPARTATTD